MPQIQSLNVHLTQVQFSPPSSFGAFLYINHDDSGQTYEVFKKTNEDVDFVSLGTTVDFNNFYLLDAGISTVQFRVNSTTDLTVEYFYSQVIAIPTAEFFVRVEGKYLSMEGEPMCDSRIRFFLAPKPLDFEIGGSVVSWNIDGFIDVEEDGSFAVSLPANKGSDGSKIISYPNTFYEFNFNDKLYIREINLDDGDVQQFSNLLVPEHKRIRREVYWDIREH